MTRVACHPGSIRALVAGVRLVVDGPPWLITDSSRTSLRSQAVSARDALVLALSECVGDRSLIAGALAQLTHLSATAAESLIAEVLERHQRYVDESFRRGSRPGARGRESWDTVRACLARLQGGDHSEIRPAGPRTLTWIVTYECHLDCQYCYVHITRANGASDSHLAGSRIVELLEEAASYGAYRLDLRGGEPFLRKDLPELIVAACGMGYTVDANTKLPLTDSMLRVLGAARGFYLGVSLDTTDPAVGDPLLRGRGMTARLQDLVRRAAALGIVVGIECTVTAKTIEQVPGVLKFAQWAGARRFHAREVAPHPRGGLADLVLSPEQSRELRDWVDGSRNAAQDTSYPGSFEIVFTPAFQSINHCQEGLQSLAFLPDGRVSKCTATLSGDSRMHYGDLTRESVFDVWHGPRLRALLQRCRGETPESGVAAFGQALTPCSQLRLMDQRPLFPRRASRLPVTGASRDS